MAQFCDDPFTSSCYPLANWWMPTSDLCANAQSKAYNVSADPLQEAATYIQSVHNACSQVTNKVCPISQLRTSGSCLTAHNAVVLVIDALLAVFGPLRYD